MHSLQSKRQSVLGLLPKKVMHYTLQLAFWKAMHYFTSLTAESISYTTYYITFAVLGNITWDALLLNFQ